MNVNNWDTLRLRLQLTLLLSFSLPVYCCGTGTNLFSATNLIIRRLPLFTKTYIQTHPRRPHFSNHHHLHSYRHETRIAVPPHSREDLDSPVFRRRCRRCSSPVDAAAHDGTTFVWIPTHNHHHTTTLPLPMLRRCDDHVSSTYTGVLPWTTNPATTTTTTHPICLLEYTGGGDSSSTQQQQQSQSQSNRGDPRRGIATRPQRNQWPDPASSTSITAITTVS
jgi:hypothetical protein